MVYDPTGLLAKIQAKAYADQKAPGLDKAHAEEQDLIAKAREQALGMAGASQGMADSMGRERMAALQGFDQAAVAGSDSLLRQGSKSLAATQGAGVGGGGLLAGSLQVGKEVGGEQANFAGQMAKQRGSFAFDSAAQVGEANKAAAADAFGATEIQRKLGSEGSNRAKATAAYNTRKAEIITTHKHWYGDDNEAMARELRDYAMTELDPMLRQQINADAANIEAGLDV